MVTLGLYFAGNLDFNVSVISINIKNKSRMCYFLPAEERKRQKMFFTHAAEGTGSEDRGERSVFCFAMLA